MDLRPYVEGLQRELMAIAEAGGGPDAAQLQRLLMQLEAATRLILLDVVTDAADEITRDLAPGSVHVRLRGREPLFVVTPASEPGELTDASDAAIREQAEPSLSQPEPDDGATWRINLRLPEHLKPGVEAAATQAGQSVNAWLTRAVRFALERVERAERGDERPRPTRSGQHFTGWAR